MYEDITAKSIEEELSAELNAFGSLPTFCESAFGT